MTGHRASDLDTTGSEVNGHPSMDPGLGLPPRAGQVSSRLLHLDQRQEAIPDIVIRRLPIYVRTLRGLQEQGTASISSDELARHIGVTAAQIRRDLSYFGKFGKQGKGYDTGFLANAIAQILGLERQWDVALAGLGNLGRAIVNYRGFGSSSFDIVALFDQNPNHIGQEIAGMPVLSDKEIQTVVQERGIQVGIIAVRAAAAQRIADQMVSGGIRAILNYAPVVLKVPEGVTIREIDPVSALQSMTYYLDGSR
ncbi:MAG TPA: redox-sensing transcriptional repressor Rex [Thermomicrobiales bacterium]|nr:redox-sensing transcriptional repressor Rex [Thermomicrobiales bacterium]